MAETTDLAKVPYQDKIIAVDNSSFANYLDTAKFEQIQRVAKMFAASDLVPEHYRNKPANCALGIHMATRLEMDPMMFLQHSYVVHGKPGLEAVIAIALVNNRGPFTGPIQWRFDGQGKTRQCTAYATHKVTKEVCSTTVTWAMVEAEGWNKKTGSKWLTMPDLMFQYRSASFLAKLYCPETILGLPTKEELEDIEAGDKYEPAPKTGRIEERLKKMVKTVQYETCAKCEMDFEESEMRVDANGRFWCDTCLDKYGTTKGRGPFGNALAEAEKTAEEKLGADTSVIQDNPSTVSPEDELLEAKKADEMAELNQFTKPPAEKPQKTTQDAVESTNQVPANERYYCPSCEGTFGSAKGIQKTICPNGNCLKIGIIDRWAKTDKTKP